MRIRTAVLLISFALGVKGTAAPAPEVEEGYVPTDDGTRLFYQKIGHGSRTVIIPLRFYSFETFKQLSDEYTVIGYDTRNRGRSDPVPDAEKPSKLTIQNDVADLERIREHFKIKKASLIGYSYLGLMVVIYAMEHLEAVERIVQLGPVPIKFGTQYPDNLTNKDEPGDPKLLEELRRLRKEENYHVTHPKEYCEKEWAYSRLGLVGNPANADKITAQPCEMPNEYPVNLARHFEAAFTSVQKLDLPKDKISAVKVPVLTIHGTKDRNAPYGAGREWALSLPNARLLTIKDGAHQSFDEFPEIVVPAVRKFLGATGRRRQSASPRLRVEATQGTLLGSRDRNLAAAAKRRGNKEVPRKLGILRLVHHTSIAVGTLDRTIWTLENGKNTNYESERAGASRHRRIQRNDFVEMNVKSEDLGQ